MKLNEHPVEPIAQNVERYRIQQQIFRELYCKVKDLYPKIHRE